MTGRPGLKHGPHLLFWRASRLGRSQDVLVRCSRCEHVDASCNRRRRALRELVDDPAADRDWWVIPLQRWRRIRPASAATAACDVGGIVWPASAAAAACDVGRSLRPASTAAATRVRTGDDGDRWRWPLWRRLESTAAAGSLGGWAIWPASATTPTATATKPTTIPAAATRRHKWQDEVLRSARGRPEGRRGHRVRVLSAD